MIIANIFIMHYYIIYSVYINMHYYIIYSVYINTVKTEAQ